MSEVFVRGHFVDEMGARVSEQITLQINEQIRFRYAEQITLHMNGQISRQMSQPIRLQMIACRAPDEQMMRDEDEDQKRLIQKKKHTSNRDTILIPNNLFVLGVSSMATENCLKIYVVIFLLGHFSLVQ